MTRRNPNEALDLVNKIIARLEPLLAARDAASADVAEVIQRELDYVAFDLRAALVALGPPDDQSDSGPMARSADYGTP